MHLEYVRPLRDNNRLLTALLNRSVSPSLPGVSRVPSDHLASSTRHPSGHQRVAIFYPTHPLRLEKNATKF